tara:strand:+ start:744 stop:1001 length:258 start_codon:yes stop_codon:yes gene_type:complete
MNKEEHKKRSANYKAQLKQAIYAGDFERIVCTVMLLAVKNNEADDWKASPRTFMELLQVLSKYRAEFGDSGMEDILKVLEGGKED